MMYEIVYYETVANESPVRVFVEELDARAETDKDARIQLKQLLFYIEMLKNLGTRAGQNFVKHLSGEIWELRPGSNRVLFFSWTGNKFVLLHQFRKTTQKTPIAEIEQATREMNDWSTRKAGEQSGKLGDAEKRNKIGKRGRKTRD